MASVYAWNNAIGIFNYDEVQDELRHFEDRPTENECPEPEFINEVDPDTVSPPDGIDSVTEYFEAHQSLPGCLISPIQEPLLYLGEYNSGEICVNRAGYIPLVRRIEDLLRAGENLQAYRESVYDGHDIGDENMPINPFRAQSNMDLTDYDDLVKKTRSVQEFVKSEIDKGGTNGVGKVEESPARSQESGMEQSESPAKPAQSDAG